MSSVLNEQVVKELQKHYKGNIQLQQNYSLFNNLRMFVGFDVNVSPRVKQDELYTECFHTLQDFVMNSPIYKELLDDTEKEIESLREENEELKKYKIFFEMQKELKGE